MGSPALIFLRFFRTLLLLMPRSGSAEARKMSRDLKVEMGALRNAFT